MSDPLPSFLALARGEPPLLAWQANPAHADWQAELARRQAAADAAAANVSGPAQAQADAQAAYDEAAAAAPEPTIANNKGVEVTNPAYTTWLKRMAGLTSTLNAANTALAQARQAASDALNLRNAWAAAEPAAQIVIDSPDHASWAQRIADARTALEATRWNTVYDADGVQAQQLLQAAQAQLAAANVALATARNGLAQAQAQVGPLAAQVAAQTAEADAARQARDRTQAGLDALVQQQQVLAGQQPPPTVTEPNPDYAPWQARMASLQQALNAARAQAAGPQQAVADAQQAVDDHLAIEPDATIENSHGAQIPNPAHRVWATEQARLNSALSAAQAAAAPSQQALAAAQAAWDAGNAAMPPATRVVTNPAWQAWSAQTAQLVNAVSAAQVQRAIDQGQFDGARLRLASTQAAWQAAQARVDTLPAQIASLEGSLPALQLAVTRASAAQSVEAEWIAALLGGPASDSVVVAVFDDLFSRWRAAADAAHDLDAAAQAEDDELWRLQARIDELDRKAAAADAASAAVIAAKKLYDDANAALELLSQNEPELL